MKKVLLGTTALVAAGAFASVGAAQANDMMEPVSVGVGGYYKAAIGFVSGDAANDVTEGDNAGNSVQSPSIAQDIEIGVSGSTTLDNGLTVGVHANIEGNVDGTSAKGSNAIDERWISFSGSFGDIQLGSIESASQQLTNFAPGGASNFGVNSPFFIFAPNGYITTYNDGIGDEDSAKLVYFSPSFNGFRIGASFAPGDAHQGQYGGNASGGMVDHTSIAAEYSIDFGGASIRAMIGHETYSADGVCDGSAMSSLAVEELKYPTKLYSVDQKRSILYEAFNQDEDDGLGDYSDAAAREDAAYEATEHDMAVDKAIEVWGGTDNNPLLDITPATADAAEVINGLNGGGTEDGLNIDGANSVYDFRTGKAPTKSTKKGTGAAVNCEPEAMRYGLTISSGAFSVGGGILTKDVANDLESTSYDLGVSYSDGAYTVGLQMANSETDVAGGGSDEVERMAINASYALGPGISLQAQADSGESTKHGMEGVDWTQIMFGTSIGF